MTEMKQEDEINSIIEWLFSAGPIASMTGNEFAKSNIDLVTQVSEYFKSIGGKIEREGFGEVALTRQGVRSSIAHGIGRFKAIAFWAVPEIIKKGKIVEHQVNWKNRGYDTYVIVAPILINKIEYIAEVIVNSDKDGSRFYLHEVEEKKKAQSAFKTGMDTSAPQASNLIIIKKLKKVK